MKISISEAGLAIFEFMLLFSFVFVVTVTSIQSPVFQELLAEEDLRRTNSFASVSANSYHESRSVFVNSNGRLAVFLPAHWDHLDLLRSDYERNMGLAGGSSCAATVNAVWIAGTAGLGSIEEIRGPCVAPVNTFCETRVLDLFTSVGGGVSRNEELFTCLWDPITGPEALQVLALPGQVTPTL